METTQPSDREAAFLPSGWRAFPQRHSWASWYLPVSLVFGAAAGLATAASRSVRTDGATVLYGEAALAVAVLAIVYTALSVMVAFLAEE
jgi:hypothetical protein